MMNPVKLLDTLPKNPRVHQILIIQIVNLQKNAIVEHGISSTSLCALMIATTSCVARTARKQTTFGWKTRSRCGQRRTQTLGGTVLSQRSKSKERTTALWVQLFGKIWLCAHPQGPISSKLAKLKKKSV